MRGDKQGGLCVNQDEIRPGCRATSLAEARQPLRHLSRSAFQQGTVNAHFGAAADDGAPMVRMGQISPLGGESVYGELAPITGFYVLGDIRRHAR